MFNWLYRKPKLLKIENKKYKSLKILKIVKDIDDLVECLNLIRDFPYLYDGNWNVTNTFDTESLSIQDIVLIHNAHPLNNIVDIEKIEKEIIESDFVLKERQKIFVMDYLKGYKNVITVEGFINKKNEDHIVELLRSEKTDDELEDEFGELVNAEEFFQNKINEQQITGHALFLYDEAQKDINLYQFHTFKEFYDNLKKVLMVYPKEYLRYSVSDDLLTLDEYISFLKLFGPFSNIENCETIEELNEWIMRGRYLMTVEEAFKNKEFNSV
jgi:hypothetical protein